MKLRLLFALIVISLTLTFSYYIVRNQLNSSQAEQAFLMDTVVSVKVIKPSDSNIARLALAKIKSLDQLLNKYSPSSEIARLNRGEKFKISFETKAILELAETMRKKTNGSFDVRFNNELDLGGIAKGYAADRARELLLEAGAKSAMIDMGSSLAVLGEPKNGQAWTIGVQDPNNKAKILGRIDLLAGQAVSTSGNYERGNHIFDPRAKKPAGLCSSVTVVCSSAARSDALATAVFVLGPEKGLRLLEELPGVEGLVIDVDNNITHTTNFRLK